MQNAECRTQNDEGLYDADGVRLHRGTTEKTKEFTYKFMISVDGAPEVPLESLTAEQRAEAGRRMTENLSRVMSEYYSLHPEEYNALLCKASAECKVQNAE